MQIKNGNSIVCDISVVLYGVLLLSFFFLGNNIQSGVYIFHLCFLIILYLFFRLILIIAPKVTFYILHIIIISCCLIELKTGYLQLFGQQHSNHCLYTITGSFQNPGPYGGFLAICISLFTAYCISHKIDQSQNLISKLFYWGASIVAIVSFVLLPSTQSRSAILALGCSMILLAFGTENIKIKIRPILKKYGFWLLLGATTLIVSAYLFKKPSADGRLFMDKICIKAMCDNGWRGAGIGHFGEAYGNAQASYFKKQIDEKGKDDLDWRAINEHDRMIADCPDNAFNEYLFIGVETGPMAMLLLFFIIITSIVISFKRGTIWCYALTAFAVFALFSYPLHVKQFQIMLPVLLAACLSDCTQNILEHNDESKAILAKDTNALLKLVTTIILFVVSSTFFVLNLPEARLYKQAKKTWTKSERWHKMEYYEYVVEDCDSLLPYMKHDYRFLFAYGQSLNKTGNYEKSDSILIMGTEISSDPMFWNVMGNNSLALGKYREAEERYKHAFYMVPNRLYPLYLLGKMYHEEGDTAKFLYMAEKIASFPPKIESINTEQMRNEIKEIRIDYMLKQMPLYIRTDIRLSAPR